MSKLVAVEYKRFEDIKHIREDGTEYWSARELAEVLEYTQWRNFHNVIKRGMIACKIVDMTVLSILLRSAKSLKQAQQRRLLRIMNYRDMLAI